MPQRKIPTLLNWRAETGRVYVSDGAVDNDEEYALRNRDIQEDKEGLLTRLTRCR